MRSRRTIRTGNQTRDENENAFQFGFCFRRTIQGGSVDKKLAQGDPSPLLLKKGTFGAIDSST